MQGGFVRGGLDKGGSSGRSILPSENVKVEDKVDVARELNEYRILRSSLTSGLWDDVKLALWRIRETFLEGVDAMD
jgi:hypothetical protein